MKLVHTVLLFHDVIDSPELNAEFAYFAVANRQRLLAVVDVNRPSSPETIAHDYWIYLEQLNYRHSPRIAAVRIQAGLTPRNSHYAGTSMERHQTFIKVLTDNAISPISINMEEEYAHFIESIVPSALNKTGYRYLSGEAKITLIEWANKVFQKATYFQK